jgi:NAD+ kinase
MPGGRPPSARPPAVALRLRPHAVDVVRFYRDTHSRRARVKVSLLDLPPRPDQLIELVPEHLRERVRTARRPAEE